jgi:GR25 family glycosyltransferase involved in LPS biosynthesis
MQLKINELFDNVFVINLKRRPDRLKTITEKLNDLHIKFEVIEAVDGSLLDADKSIGNGCNHKGVAGCALSHRKVAALAKERHYKNYLVIEDDCEFSEDFNELFNFYYKQLPKDWDMIYFGGNHQLQPTAVNVNVGKLQHTYTTHCFAINQGAYNNIIEFVGDSVEKLKEPIDVTLTRIQKQGKSYVFKPHLVWQEGSFSDIEQKQQDADFLKPAHDKASLIISSYNQKSRLRFCLKSAMVQNYFNYEIIVADDLSSDGTEQMIVNDFPAVKLIKNINKSKNCYTLSDNWNNAAKSATGKRLIFTNADNILARGYISAHMDQAMEKDIIFGPNEQTDSKIEKLLDLDISAIDLIKKYTAISAIKRDLRHDDAAYTYNKNYNYWYPWGNNFSVNKKDFDAANGFPPLKEYGGEEFLLVKKLNTRFDVEIKSNKNAYNLHLWHTTVNKSKKPFDENAHGEYINS